MSAQLAPARGPGPGRPPVPLFWAPPSSQTLISPLQRRLPEGLSQLLPCDSRDCPQGWGWLTCWWHAGAGAAVSQHRTPARPGVRAAQARWARRPPGPTAGGSTWGAAPPPPPGTEDRKVGLGAQEWPGAGQLWLGATSTCLVAAGLPTLGDLDLSRCPEASPAQVPPSLPVSHQAFARVAPLVPMPPGPGHPCPGGR